MSHRQILARLLLRSACDDVSTEPANQVSSLSEIVQTQIKAHEKSSDTTVTYMSEACTIHPMHVAMSKLT